MSEQHNSGDGSRREFLQTTTAAGLALGLTGIAAGGSISDLPGRPHRGAVRPTRLPAARR